MTYQRGDRIVLVLTSDPHTRLVPGTTGTVTSYDTRLGHLAVTWDDGSTLAMLLHDGDQVRPLLRPGLRPETVRSTDGRHLIEIIPRADRSYAVVLRSAATGQVITDQLPRTARQMITLVRAWAADGPGPPELVTAEEDLDPSGRDVPQRHHRPRAPAAAGCCLNAVQPASWPPVTGCTWVRNECGPSSPTRWPRARSWSATTPSPTGTTQTTDPRSAAASTTPTQIVPRR